MKNLSPSKSTPLQVESFFLVSPLGFEDLTLSELNHKYPLIQQHLKKLWPWDGEMEVKKFIGGIEVKLPMVWGWCLNFYLKIPTRILQRLDSFVAKDFPKLYQKAKQVRWHPFLTKQGVQIHASAHKSRLIHSKKIATTLEAALTDLQVATPLPDLRSEAPYREKLHLYARLDHDLCTLSIDTSGERLHKRAYRPQGSRASIRENLAAALVWKMHSYIPSHMTASALTLVDALCGSGTFLFESTHFYRKSDARDFAFTAMPLAISVLPLLPKLADLRAEGLFQRLQGSDINMQMVTLAQSILDKSFNESKVQMEFTQGDAFQKKQMTNLKAQTTVVLSNPPYGKRLENRKVSLLYYQELVHGLCFTWKPLYLGILVPLPYAKLEILVPEGFEFCEKFFFKNSGLEVALWVLKSSST